VSLAYACRDGIPCLLHYAGLSYDRQVEVARRVGIETGTGSAHHTSSLSGRAERTPDGRQPRGHERWREASGV
jgi:hypothetical protein